jgi:hypothetical protein
VRQGLEQAALRRAGQFSWESCARQTLATLTEVGRSGTVEPLSAET